MSNASRNKKEINAYRNQLRAMCDDISDIDNKVLEQSVNAGKKFAKKITPVGKSSKNHTGGYLRKSWHTKRVSGTLSGAQIELYNSADYSSYVNYGHRIVTKAKITVGFVPGQYLLEKTCTYIDKQLAKRFKMEVDMLARNYK